MTDITLVRCPFCPAQCAEVLAVEIDIYAAVCRACGAHGPARVLGPKQLVEQVKLQAARDWNQAARDMDSSSESPARVLASILRGLGYQLDDQIAYSVIEYIAGDAGIEGPAAASPVEGQAHQEEPGAVVSTEAPGTSQLPDGMRLDASRSGIDEMVSEMSSLGLELQETVTNTTTTPGPSTDPATICTRQPDSPQGRESDAPAGGGAKGKAITANQLELGDRLARFLDDIGMSAQGAADKGMDFGVHVATVYNILKGKRVSDMSLEAVAKALTRMERSRKLSGAANQQTTGTKAVQTAAEYDESLIQKLPTNFPEPAGANRAPAPVAPPRHARAP
jgi:hypothetical protein